MASAQHPADYFWHLLLTAQAEGRSVLPSDLGLGSRRAAALRHRTGILEALTQHDADRVALIALRDEQRQAIEQLLLAHRSSDPDAGLMARVVATAVLGGSHLWRDLGMPDRPALRELLTHYFPVLVVRNVHNLRWKKFLFRLLCEASGDHLCPAPDCSVCSERGACVEPPEGAGLTTTAPAHH